MNPVLPENPGDRPSKLLLARFATGELTGEERDRVAAWLEDHPEGRAHLDDLEAARDRVRPFDATALRRRASQVADEAPAIPSPANRPLLRFLVPLLVAALALLMLVPRWLGPDDSARDPIGVRIKGDEALVVYTLQGDTLVPWTGAALGEGDTVGFRVAPAGHEHVVLLSVDGAGTATVFYPGAGESPEPLPRGVADVALPLTVTLDAAPGPEVFVAVFDVDPEEARAQALSAWQAGGPEGLREWARQHAADAVAVEKR